MPRQGPRQMKLLFRSQLRVLQTVWQQYWVYSTVIPYFL
jgi:hypothetical protein